MSGRASGAVVIGASAGALEALSALLPALPRRFPLPVLIVVHVPPDRHSVLAELLARHCALPVTEAEDKVPVRGGVVYFAPPDYHLLVEMDKTLSLSNDEPVLFSRPSIDVLFESAADVYGPQLTGVVLTGASEDGARGLQAVIAAGGQGIVQDPASAQAAAMPAAAIARCPAARVLPLSAIGPCLRELAA